MRPFLQAADEVLRYRNITDAALVFDGEQCEPVNESYAEVAPNKNETQE